MHLLKALCPVPLTAANREASTTQTRLEFVIGD
jgi:hypothetical protein